MGYCVLDPCRQLPCLHLDEARRIVHCTSWENVESILTEGSGGSAISHSLDHLPYQYEWICTGPPCSGGIGPSQVPPAWHPAFRCWWETLLTTGASLTTAAGLQMEGIQPASFVLCMMHSPSQTWSQSWDKARTIEVPSHTGQLRSPLQQAASSRVSHPPGSRADPPTGGLFRDSVLCAKLVWTRLTRALRQRAPPWSADKKLRFLRSWLTCLATSLAEVFAPLAGGDAPRLQQLMLDRLAQPQFWVAALTIATRQHAQLLLAGDALEELEAGDDSLATGEQVVQWYGRAGPGDWPLHRMKVHIPTAAMAHLCAHRWGRSLAQGQGANCAWCSLCECRGV